jgi:Flp pilus assembly protein TadD
VEHATRACELSYWKEPRHISILAAAYAEAGEFAKAIEYQKKALSFPEFEKQHGAQVRERLELYTHQKPYRETDWGLGMVAPPGTAVSKYWPAVRRDPNNASAHYFLGNALLNQWKLDEAIAQYREAFRLESNTPDARNHLASALNRAAWMLATDADPQKREPGRALKLSKEAVELAPKDADCWNTLGVAHYRAGSWNDAVIALQKYREVRTSDAEWGNPFFLAMAQWQLGNKDEARRWYNQAIDWMDHHAPTSESLIGFRSEAAQLLGIPLTPSATTPATRP